MGAHRLKGQKGQICKHLGMEKNGSTLVQSIEDSKLGDTVNLERDLNTIQEELDDLKMCNLTNGKTLNNTKCEVMNLAIRAV